MSSPSESVNLIEPGHQYFSGISGGLDDFDLTDCCREICKFQIRALKFGKTKDMLNNLNPRYIMKYLLELWHF